MGKHINFTGWVVKALTDDFAETDAERFTFCPVIAGDPDRDICDVCIEGRADYIVDASILGQAGVSLGYCQECATWEASGPEGDAWFAPAF